MTLAKIIWSLACLLLLASHLWSMSGWHEHRGIYDDICYLRQAHLFQRFGWISGLDTDIVRDDDRYFAGKLKEVELPQADDPSSAPCHSVMPATGRRVMQYPPGTGFVLSLFPAGHQVIPMFMLSTLVVCLVALLTIGMAGTLAAVVTSGVCGVAAIYVMINPVKASYSAAPTMAVCTLAGLVSAWLFATRRPGLRVALSIAVGCLIGLSVNFRLGNLFLSAGYFIAFGVAVLRTRRLSSLIEGIAFGLAFIAGLAPTLAANAINAGSPLTTTYSSGDAVPPDLTVIFSQLALYLSDTQGIMLLIACGITLSVWLIPALATLRSLAAMNAVNIAVNMAYFLTHPIATPYYIMPIAMLALWTALFGCVLHTSVPIPTFAKRSGAL